MGARSHGGRASNWGAGGDAVAVGGPASDSTLHPGRQQQARPGRGPWPPDRAGRSSDSAGAVTAVSTSGPAFRSFAWGARILPHPTGGASAQASSPSRKSASAALDFLRVAPGSADGPPRRSR